LIEQTFALSQQFFQQPPELKHLLQDPAIPGRGYDCQNQSFIPGTPPDLKESFNFGREPGHGITTRGNFWPQGIPGFRATSLAFFDACFTSASEILKAFAIALNMPEDYFVTRHMQRNGSTVRLLHYPPVTEPAQAGQVRAGAHSDWGSITLLFQDANGGLEVRNARGNWIPAPYLPETVLVNTGDMIERWTNHRFRSTLHRVSLPHGEATLRSRYSIACFFDPDLEAMIECLSSCQSSEHPVLYPPISSGDYLRMKLQETMRALPTVGV
jgi:isopenicillin N synthase-like dioxygenase